MDVLIPPRLKNREKHKILCVKIDKRSFCIFCIVIMLSLIQLGSIRDNLSPDSLGILGRIYLIETHEKNHNIKMMFVKEGKKRKSAQGNALLREVFLETHILLQKETSSQILFQNFCKVLWKVHVRT